MSVTADKVGWRLLPFSTRSSMTPDRGPLYRPGGGVLRSGADVTLGTGLQWSGARQAPFRRWRGFYGRGWCFGWVSAVIHAGGHWQYAAMTVSPVEAGFTIPQTGAQLETPGMLAVAPFMDTSGW